jgi:hypothetical protein
MPRQTFKGSRAALTRSKYGKRARQAKDSKLATLRGKERGENSNAFKKAVEVAYPPKKKGK